MSGREKFETEVFMPPSNAQLNKMIAKAQAQRDKAAAVASDPSATEDDKLEAAETVIDMDAKIARLTAKLT
jgi:hypothetical protein